jgi:hypothetical protein
MLDDELRFNLARHLLEVVPGLDAVLLNEDRTAFRTDASKRLDAQVTAPNGRILGGVAMDLWNGSGGTLIGEAITHLTSEEYSRLADAIRAIS